MYRYTICKWLPRRLDHGINYYSNILRPNRLHFDLESQFDGQCSMFSFITVIINTATATAVEMKYRRSAIQTLLKSD